MKLPVIFKILLPLVAGILVGYYYSISVGFVAVLISFGIAISVYFLFQNQTSAQKYFFGLAGTLFFFITGLFLEGKHDDRKNDSYFCNSIKKDTTNFFQIEILTYPEITDRWIKSEVSVVESNHQATIGNALVYFERDNISDKLKYGDQIYASANFFPINPPSNPNEFNYQAYLAHHSIYHQAYIQSGVWIATGNDANPILESVYNTRKKCSEIIDNSSLKEENKAVAKALLIGDKEYISDDLMLSYAASGTLHVLAVSGLHVGIVMLILNFLLQPVKRIKNGKIIFLILALTGIWFYTLLTGFSPSILRAAVMFSFVLIGNQLQRDTSIYQSLLVSALILILLDPHVIFQIGFLLSYLAVLGIVFFHPKIYSLFYFKNKIMDKIWQISSVSIAAQIATFPLSIYCFHQFPNYFLLANLMVIPVSFLVLILGIFALIFYFIPPISDLIFYGIDALITFMNEGVKFVEKLPWAITDGISIMWYDAILLFVFIFLVTFSITKKSKSYLLTSFGIFTLFFLSLVYQTNYKYKLKQIVFYAVKNEIIVDVFSNSQITSICTNSICSDTSNLKFHVYPNRVFNSGKTEPFRQITIANSSNLFSIHGKQILFLDQSLLDCDFTDKFPLVDCIYLYNTTYVPKLFLNAVNQHDIKVISGFGNSYKTRGYLSSHISKNAYYDLSKKGALVIDF